MKKLNMLYMVIFLLALTIFQFPIFQNTVNATTIDTTATSSVSHASGRSVTVDFTMDSVSTNYTVTNWLDMTESKDKDIYFSLEYSDLTFGRSVNNDSMKVVVQSMEKVGTTEIVMDADTSAVITSSGVGQQYKITPSAYMPYWRLKFINFNTGGAKNGYGSVKGGMYAVPKL